MIDIQEKINTEKLFNKDIKRQIGIVQRKVNSVAKKLINEIHENGIYENLGQNESSICLDYLNLKVKTNDYQIMLYLRNQIIRYFDEFTFMNIHDYEFDKFTFF